MILDDDDDDEEDDDEVEDNDKDDDNNLSTIFYLCKTRKRSLKINRNSHRLELETPPKDYTLAHWSTQYENQFTLSFFYLGKKTNKNIVFLKKIIVLVLHVVGTNVEGKIIF